MQESGPGRGRPGEQQLFALEPTWSVTELSQAIGAGVNRLFPDEIWVQGEIANLQRPSSGHVYFDLVDDGCRLRVTLWASDKQVVNGVLRRAGGAVRMVDGTEVRIRVRVTWWGEGGQLALRMLSIDTAFTLGRLAEARELLLQRLAADGTLEAQRRLPPPLVPVRVGLITSDGSAAAADFLRTLEASGLGFRVTLVDARVQGLEAVATVIAGLRTLGAMTPPLDVVCVVRGGGARTDLATFDDESIARAIAALPVPLLTGIGHEIDTTVADHVAHHRAATPTACAAWLVDRVRNFRDGIAARSLALGRLGTSALGRADRAVAARASRTAADAEHGLRLASARVRSASTLLAARPVRRLDACADRVEVTAARVRALDPASLLARGWSITRDGDGQLIRSTRAVIPGTTLVTELADGRVTSRVADEP